MIPSISKEELNAIFANNLKRLMNRDSVKAVDIANALKLSYMTVSDWVNGKSIPRMDKMEMLANYFSVSKAELIETNSLQNGKNSTLESSVKPQLRSVARLEEGDISPDEDKAILTYIKLLKEKGNGV